MTDREKLVEMIEMARCKMWGEQVTGRLEKDYFFADYLLSHGVTVREPGRWVEKTDLLGDVYYDCSNILTEAEVLAQLAEELMEAGHAALKLRRALDGSNPTPVTVEDAKAMLTEEISDVKVCLLVLDIAPDYEIVERKLRRWLERLQGASQERSE